MDNLYDYTLINYPYMIEHWYAIILIPIAIIAMYLFSKSTRDKRHDFFENFELGPKMTAGLALASKTHDFSDIIVYSGHLYDDIWGMYRGGIICISDEFLEYATVEQVACVLIHEWAHHHGYSEAEATEIGKECSKRLNI